MFEMHQVMKNYFGTSTETETVAVVEDISDQFLRAAIIKASMNMEKRIAEGRDLAPLLLKRPWGLEVHIEMERPAEDKPIIFKYTYFIDRVILSQWIEKHPYLMGGPGMTFVDVGLQILIPGPGIDNYHKTFANIELNGNADEKFKINLIEKRLVVQSHREVVSLQDWLVKCVIE